MISKRSNNYLITIDKQQLLYLYNKKQGKRVNLTDFYKIQKGINPPLLYDGKPREYHVKSNPNDNQKELMLEALRQYADIETVKININDKYIIKEIYKEPILAVDESYTKYLRPLIIDMLYKIYNKSLLPNQTLLIFAMSYNDIVYELQILGDMFHHKIFSKYDNTNNIRNSFNDKYYQIILEGYTGYLLSKVNEDIKQKILYCIETINIIGLTKREIAIKYTNEPLGLLQIQDKSFDLDIISSDIINTLKINGKSQFMLEYKYNKEMEKRINDIYTYYKEIPPLYENYKLAWEFSIDESFRTNNIDIDLDYCRKKLNLNMIYRFIKTNGLYLFEEYRDKQLKGELKEFGEDLTELQEYCKGVQINKIEHYVNDMLYIIENIAV